MKAIDRLSSETIVRLFYKQNTDFCWTIPRATIKTTNLMQWHGAICIVRVFRISAIWEGNKSNLYRHFLRCRRRIRFICERSAENEMMQFGGRYGFGSVSVRIRCICETALNSKYKFSFYWAAEFFPVLISSKHCYNGYIYGYSRKRVSIDGEFYSYYSIVAFIEDSY